MCQHLMFHKLRTYQEANSLIFELVRLDKNQPQPDPQNSRFSYTGFLLYDTLTFPPKLAAFGARSALMVKSLRVSPMKIQSFFVCLICKTLRFRWLLPEFAHDLNLRVELESIPVAMSGVFFFIV